MRIIFLLLLSGFLSEAFAQPTFNIIQEYGYPASIFRDFIVHDDNVVGIGTAFLDSSEVQGVLVVKLDSNLNVINKQFIYDTLGRILTLYNYSKRLQTTNGGGYIFCAATAEDRDAIIYKLDNNLKTVFTYEFTDTLLRSNFDYRILEIENGFVVYGTTQKQNYQVVGFVRRIDSLGNLLWNKEFLYSGSNNFVSDVVLLNDSTLVMNNVVEKTLTDGFSGLRVIDLKTGNTIQYMDTAGENKVQLMLNFSDTNDGGYVAYALELVNPLSGNGTFRSSFTKYNADLQQEWRKNWGKTRSGDAFRMFETYKDQNGHLISIGKTLRDTFIYDTFIHQNVPYDYHVGWVFKFTENGDSIWSREIPLTVPHSLNNVSKSLYGGGVLSSGNIIAGGSVEIGPNYYSWLIKLTSDGCIDSLFSCSPWTPPSSATEPFSGRNADLSAYPNPAYRWVNLQFSAREEWGKLTVFNGTGQTMLERSEWLGNGEIPVSVSTFPPGLYHAVVELSQGQRLVTRIAVVR